MFFKKPAKPVRQNAMAAAKPNTPVDISGGEPSYIGRDTAIDGHLSTDGEIHIDGSIRGGVRARICVIDLHGVVQGEVAAEVVHVRGRVIGPIQGAKVYIHAGAHVEGDVYQDSISIENGAYVYGTIRHNNPPPGLAPVFSASDAKTPALDGPRPPAPADSADDGFMEGQPMRVVHSRD
jgi:cytoskeletal protein CcmA (bactofilin family)